MHAHARTRKRTHTYIQTHILHNYTYMCTYTCTKMHINIYTCTHTHKHAHTSCSVCPLCNDKVAEAVTAVCCHQIFCRECLTNHLKQFNQCPNCKYSFGSAIKAQPQSSSSMNHTVPMDTSFHTRPVSMLPYARVISLSCCYGNSPHND